MGEFWVGDRLVRPELGEIRVGMEKVHLEPRSMAVLQTLAENPRELLAKKDLIERVWGDAFVTDEVLTHAIWDLRRALGDNASSPEFIQTVPKRGYRLIAPVKRLEQPERRKTDRAGAFRRRRPLVLLGILALVVVAAFWLGRALPRPGLVQGDRALREVTRNRLFQDPDVRPWISLDRHDPRAIRDFLVGLGYVYRNEVGAGPALEAASARDPDFVAPRIWGIGGVVRSGDRAAIARHRRELERLYPAATSFEKPMIEWAQALLEARPAAQVRHLRIALGTEPGNRPVQLNLGRTLLLALEDFDEAWRELAPLVEQGWCFPGLYTLAARCALHRRSVDDAERVLQSALECDPVDPEVLALLALLARRQEDEPAAREYDDRLERRKKEMEPETFALDLAPYAELLEMIPPPESGREVEETFR